MDEQERALLATIRDRPDDDGPRLVYADWLDEIGNCVRAEFIRIQCARAAADAYDPEQKRLAERERAILHDHAYAWARLEFRLFAPYAPPPDEPPFEPLDPQATRELAPQPRWYFHRGFPWAEISPNQFLDRGETLLGGANLIQFHIGGETYKEMMQRIRYPEGQRHRSELFHELLDSPLLNDACTGLTLTEMADWDQFAARGQDLRLTALHGVGDGLRFHHLQQIRLSPGLERVRELTLHWTRLGDGLAQHLADCQWFPRTRYLDLQDNQISAEGVAAITRALSPSRLVALDLSDNPIGDQGAHFLSRWPGLAGLRQLKLNGCGIGPYGAAALAGSPHLQGIAQMSLQRNQIRGAGVAALLDPRGAHWLGGLARLDLCGNRVGSLGAQHLTTAAPFLENLKRLYLSRDCDDLEELPLRWLTEAYGERLKLDWFEPPYG